MTYIPTEEEFIELGFSFTKSKEGISNIQHNFSTFSITFWKSSDGYKWGLVASPVFEEINISSRQDVETLIRIFTKK